MNKSIIEPGLKLLKEEFGKESVAKAIQNVAQFEVEIPSWIFGEFGGGRFGEYMPPGAARNIDEKLDDASVINKLTGAAPQVAVHILWDFSDDGINGKIEIAEKVAKSAEARGLKIGSINPTYFLKGSQRGSLSATETQTRKRYIDQTILGAEIAQKFGTDLVCLWLPDGSNYPGQIDLKKAIEMTRQSLSEISSKSDKNVTFLIEYKVFEPGTYSTVLSDWGSAYLLAKEFGANAGVLVDMGHHHYSVNIEQIVARLINDKMYCGFHFNTRYAADDDHSVEPNPEMARIFYELVSGGVVCNRDVKKNWALMIDQCSGRENRMLAVLHSIDSLQMSLAKAVLVDPQELKQLQDKDQIIMANRYFNNALLNADVRPILYTARLEKNLPVDPVSNYLNSGYQQEIENKRDN